MDLRCSYSHKLKVAITGSTGFIGKKLIERFQADDFKSQPFESLESGLTVIHLAADVSTTHQALLTNIALDTFVLENVNLKHKKLIYASTNNVYPYALNCRTNETRRFNDYYAASKVFGEQLIAECCKVPALAIRIADVFGVGQTHGNFFKALELAIRNKTPLTQYGLGLKRRTYIHVDELCEILKFVTLDMTETLQSNCVLNVGYSDSANIAEIIKKVSNLTGIEINNTPVNSVNFEDDIRTMCVSNLPGYNFLWSSFEEALSHYVSGIQS